MVVRRSWCGSAYIVAWITVNTNGVQNFFGRRSQSRRGFPHIRNVVVWESPRLSVRRESQEKKGRKSTKSQAGEESLQNFLQQSCRDDLHSAPRYRRLGWPR